VLLLTLNITKGSVDARAKLAASAAAVAGSEAAAAVDRSFNLDVLYAQRGDKLSALPIAIAPHEEYRFGPITFRPHSHTGTHGAILLLKNNLTLFQPINLIGEGGTAVVRLLDAAHLPIPYHIALNRSIDPQLYRMRASNVGPPLRQFKVRLGGTSFCTIVSALRLYAPVCRSGCCRFVVLCCT
jgi:hypothetical protein